MTTIINELLNTTNGSNFLSVNSTILQSCSNCRSKKGINTNPIIHNLPVQGINISLMIEFQIFQKKMSE